MFSGDWFITADKGQVYFRGMNSGTDRISYQSSLKQHHKPAVGLSHKPSLGLFSYGSGQTDIGNQHVNLFFSLFCALLWECSFSVLEKEKVQSFLSILIRQNMVALIILYLLFALLANVFLDAGLLKGERKATSFTWGSILSSDLSILFQVAVVSV